MPSKSLMASFRFVFFLCWYDKILIKATQEKKLISAHSSRVYFIKEDRSRQQNIQAAGPITFTITRQRVTVDFLCCCYTIVKAIPLHFHFLQPHICVISKNMLQSTPCMPILVSALAFPRQHLR